MKRKNKKLIKKFKANLLPSVIVTVSAVALICGVYYTYAFTSVPAKAPTNTLLSSDWNIMKADLDELNGRTIHSTWAKPCPAGYIDTNLNDCDSADGHLISEDACGQGGSDYNLCIGFF
jgi:hypothetical protein